MKKQNILICIDRDGTLIYDDNYYLGSQENWKSKVKILPTVTKGLKMLNSKLPQAKIYIVTNQPAVAVKEFPLLTQKKAEQVCQFVIKKLKSKKIFLQGCEVCNHASKAYQRRKRGVYTFHKKYTYECTCMKPKPGMILAALKKENFKKSETSIYMIGDRATDMQAGHNACGTEIYIRFENIPDQKPKLKKLRFKFHTAINFWDAAKFIVEREK